jgi:hypothetical protein
VQKKAIKKIVIGKIGSLATRSFLDDVSHKLTSKLKKLNIETESVYLGSTKAEAITEIRKIKIIDFEALIIFFPTDSLVENEVSTYQNFVMGLPSYDPNRPTPTHHSFKYAQTFKIKLYNNSVQWVPAWEAKLKVNVDCSKHNIYGILADKVIGSLKENNFVN